MNSHWDVLTSIQRVLTRVRLVLTGIGLVLTRVKLMMIHVDSYRSPVDSGKYSCIRVVLIDLFTHFLMRMKKVNKACKSKYLSKMTSIISCWNFLMFFSFFLEWSWLNFISWNINFNYFFSLNWLFMKLENLYSFKNDFKWPKWAPFFDFS